MASLPRIDDEDDFGGDYPGIHDSGKHAGEKRPFGDLDEEDDVFGAKKDLEWSELQFDEGLKGGSESLDPPETDQCPFVVEYDKDIVVSETIKSELVLQPLEIANDLTNYFTTDEIFASREALIQWSQNLGRELKIVVIVLKSEKATPARKARLILGCERGGVYRNHTKKTSKPEQKKQKIIPRKSGTRKCNCPFELKGVPLESNMWKVQVACGQHNHELPETLVGHSYAARLSTEEKRILVDMTLSGMKPKEVLAAIKSHSNTNLSTMKTIYNAKAKMRLIDAGKHDMQDFECSELQFAKGVKGGSESLDPPEIDQSPSVAEIDKYIIVPETIKSELVVHPLEVANDLTNYFTTDEVFTSREALVEWSQNLGRELKTVVIVLKSDKATPVRKARLILGCERGGVYRDHKKKTSKTEQKKQKIVPQQSGTRKCNCPFELKGIPLESNMWKVQVACGQHNHELPETLVGHSYAGRLSREEKRILVDMTMSGMKPREVFTTIKRRSDTNLSTMRTIYNAKAKMRLNDARKNDIEGKSKVEESGPGAATGMILSLRESLQNCKDDLATCQSELDAARSEIQKWHSAFQNGPATPADTSPEPGILVTYLQNLKSSEESLKEQLEKAKKREAAFIVTFAKREQEIADLKSAVRDLKTQLRPPSVQTRRLVLDPAIHEEFTRLKNLVEEKEKKVKELQDNVAAVNFTVSSKMGKMLMAKCRTLQDENEEIGAMASEGKIHDLAMKIAVLKSQNAELRNHFEALYKHMEGLTSDVERSNEMAYILQAKLEAQEAEVKRLTEQLSQKEEKDEVKDEEKEDTGDTNIVNEEASAEAVDA